VWAASAAPAPASDGSLRALWPGEITLTDPALPTAPAVPAVPAVPAAPAALAKPRVHGSEAAAAQASPAPGSASSDRGPAPKGRGVAKGCDSRGATVRKSGSRRRREIALTFDDGPWPDTRQFLDVLERERVGATFFLIGRQVAGNEELLRRMLRDGDAIGNHTFSHPDLRRLSPSGVRHELSAASDAIHHAVGYRPCLFRPPYGGYDRTIVGLAAARHMTTVTWDVDPRDWSRPGSAAIEQRVRAQVRPGSIVLMHDGGGPRTQTLAALPRIVHALRRRGMRLVTLPEMLGYRVRYRPG
jgi:peptidoglycan/xylan/chitin deacetylase (PgdA/CDA1 family)